MKCRKILVGGAAALGLFAAAAFGSMPNARAVDPPLDVALTVNITGNTPFYKGANYAIEGVTSPTFTVSVSNLANDREVCVGVGVSQNNIGRLDIEDCKLVGLTKGGSGISTFTVPLVYEDSGCGWNADGSGGCDKWLTMLPIDDGKVKAFVFPVAGSGDEKYIDAATVIAQSGDYTVGYKDFDFSGIKTTKLEIEDVGVHSAGLKATYNIPSALDKSKISGVALSATIYRVFEYLGKNEGDGGRGGGGVGLWNCTGGVSDSGLSEADAKKIHSVKRKESGDKDNKIDEYGWYYYYVAEQWFNRCTTSDGSFDLITGNVITLPLLGLIENTKYGNWRSIDWEKTREGDPEFGVMQFDVASSLFAGVVLKMEDGSIWTENLGNTMNAGVWGLEYFGDINAWNLVPEFTTAKFAPKADKELTDENKGGLVGGDDNSAAADSVYRIYVNSLKESCKVAIEAGDTCYWTGYIYSEPTKLIGKNGGELLEIFKDEDGNYYVEVAIPASFKGQHQIALYDEEDNLVGWIPVSIIKTPNAGVFGEEGASARQVMEFVVPAAGVVVAAGVWLVFKRSRKLLR